MLAYSQSTPLLFWCFCIPGSEYELVGIMQKIYDIVVYLRRGVKVVCRNQVWNSHTRPLRGCNWGFEPQITLFRIERSEPIHSSPTWPILIHTLQKTSLMRCTVRFFGFFERPASGRGERFLFCSVQRDAGIDGGEHTFWLPFDNLTICCPATCSLAR